VDIGQSASDFQSFGTVHLADRFIPLQRWRNQKSNVQILTEGKSIMFYALNWFVVLILLALWSLAAWGFHTIAAWTIANAAGLKGGSSEILSQGVPAWLAPWMQPELASTLPAMVSSLTPAVDFLLGLAPGLAGVLSLAVWFVWAIGSVLLIVLGIVVSTVIAVLRRRRSAKPNRYEA
jgi:hypothetical protein